LGAPEANGSIPIEITITNDAGSRLRADTVHVVDTIPEGFTYVWQSVSASPGKVRVVNLKPLEFELEPIAAGGTVILMYSIRPVS
jgi:uncharacterized repeat protein (TIGR01451 family)